MAEKRTYNGRVVWEDEFEGEKAGNIFEITTTTTTADLYTFLLDMVDNGRITSIYINEVTQYPRPDAPDR